jgi:hypothetical protein
LPPVAAGFGAQISRARTSNYCRLAVKNPDGPPRKSRPPYSGRESADDDLVIIEQLLALALAAIDRKTPEVRLADILKLLEFKQRVQPQTDVRAVFWEWIERFRREAARQAEGEKNS